jgi:hypothetical protein
MISFENVALNAPAVSREPCVETKNADELGAGR